MLGKGCFEVAEVRHGSACCMITSCMHVLLLLATTCTDGVAVYGMLLSALAGEGMCKKEYTLSTQLFNCVWNVAGLCWLFLRLCTWLVCGMHLWVDTVHAVSAGLSSWYVFGVLTWLDSSQCYLLPSQLSRLGFGSGKRSGTAISPYSVTRFDRQNKGIEVGLLCRCSNMVRCLLSGEPRGLGLSNCAVCCLLCNA